MTGQNVMIAGACMLIVLALMLSISTADIYDVNDKKKTQAASTHCRHN